MDSKYPQVFSGFLKMKERKSLSFIDGIFVTEMRTALSQNDIFGNPIGMLIDQKEIAQIVFKYSNKSFQF
jgi:hypothetical protein